MAAFIKSLSRLLGSNPKPVPALHFAAFGKHPGWDDHLDDLGLDTDALIAAKRLLYVQGISQNIDSGAWDKLDAAAAPDGSIGRLDLFRHVFLWHMQGGSALLAGRFWSSSDGKGRAKYPMVLCVELAELPDRFAAEVVFPFLIRVHEQCAAARTAESVRRIYSVERDNLIGHLKNPPAALPLAARQVAAVAGHSDMHPPNAPSGVAAQGAPSSGPAEEMPNTSGGGGFHRIVYQFASGMSAYRTPGTKSATPRRPEQVRLPTCGMSPSEALLFWYRFALTFIDSSTPILLIAPDQEIGGTRAPWVDLIAGEPAPANVFCIKAGTRSLPFTSDIPYTLDPTLLRAIDGHIAHCAGMPEGAPFPPWPMFQ